MTPLAAATVRDHTGTADPFRLHSHEFAVRSESVSVGDEYACGYSQQPGQRTYAWEAAQQQQQHSRLTTCAMLEIDSLLGSRAH